MKLREIERLRGVAILMVLVMHWGCFQALMPPVARSSWSGVDLFFVISGYVVTLSLVRLLPPLEGEASFLGAFARARQALKVFYTRRFFRIVPAALFAILLHRYLAGAAPQLYGSVRQCQHEAIAFFAGIYNYHAAITGEDKLIPLWSLAVEEHFYLVLPILLVSVRTTNRRLGVCAFIVAFCILARHFDSAIDRNAGRLDWDVSSPLLYDKFASHLRFDSLMAGVMIALASQAGPAFPSSPILAKSFLRFVLLPACVVLIACLPGASPDYLLQRQEFIALWMLSGILVAFARLDAGYVLSFPVVGRVLEYVGSRSYALYIVHYDLGKLDEWARHDWPRYATWIPADEPTPLRRCAVVFGATLLVADLLHRLIEKPFIAYGRALGEPSRPERFAMSARMRRLLVAAVVVVVLFALRHRIERVFGPRDLALGKPVRASSQQPDSPGPAALVNGVLEPEKGLQTRTEESPWAEIDLGAVARVGAIRIYNRADGWEGDAIPMEVSVSADGETFRTVAKIDHMFTQDWPWRVRLIDYDIRFVRLAVPRRTSLCLSEVEVFEGQTMAALP